MTRFIYWRVTTAEGALVAGRFKDLKTLKGATTRLHRAYPAWHETEVSFVPFPENFNPPNHQARRPRGVDLKEVR